MMIPHEPSTIQTSTMAEATGAVENVDPAEQRRWNNRVARSWRWVRRCLRPLHSLTFKNLALFVAIFMIALSPLAVAYQQDLKSSRIDGLAGRLELIAGLAAPRINGALVKDLRRKELTGTPDHRLLVEALADIQRDFKVDNAVLIRREDSGRFSFIADGSNQFFISQPMFVHDQFPETLVAAERAWNNTGHSYTGLFGFGTFEYLQYNKPILHEGKVVALLLLNKFAEDVDQAIRMETLHLVGMVMLLFLCGAVVFWLVSRRLLRPLLYLERASRRVAAGDLAVEIDPVRGGDEVARLNESFRAMVHEVRRSRELLQQNNEELKRSLARVQLMEDVEKNLLKFVPREVSHTLHSDPEALERGKTSQDVSVLFLDVEGSTTLAETMATEHMDRLIQEYFSRYLDCIYENQGDITETAGDGLMIIFQGEDPIAHARNAVRTAGEIQAITRRIEAENADAEHTLRINIGIASGPALVGFTRLEAISGSRLTFTASGRTTILAARLEDLAKGGSVLLSEGTIRRLMEHADGAWLQTAGWSLEYLGPVALKNLNEPEPVHRLNIGTEGMATNGNTPPADA